MGLASSYEDTPWHDLPSDFQQMYYRLAQEVLDAAALEVAKLKIVPLRGQPGSEQRAVEFGYNMGITEAYAVLQGNMTLLTKDR